MGSHLDPRRVEPLFWHWNGSAWKVVSPGVGTYGGSADDVEVLGPSDAWAVGWRLGGNLIEHWDGDQWRRVPTGLPVDEVGLEAIDSTGPGNLWAVGSKESTSPPPNRRSRAFIVHNRGNGWHPVRQPTGVAVGSVLKGVAVVSRDDIWAVGGTGLGKESWYESPKTLAEHWNGHRWVVVPTPSPGTEVNVLQSVSVIGPDDVWAVGMRQSGGHASRPLILHFNGKSWNEVASPWVGGDGSDLFEVSSSATMGTWAFGRRGANGDLHPLVERLGSAGWARVHQAPRWGALIGGWVGDDAVWAVGETAQSNHVRPLVERLC